MASRKEQKEQARAARIAEQERTAAKAQQTRRLQIFGGAIAIAVIVIVVAIVISSGGGGNTKTTSTGLPTGQKQRQIISSVDSLLGGIPQSGVTLGDPNAKVTMTYLGDLQCPICKEFTLLVLPSFIQQEVKTHHAKVVYRSSCTASCNNSSVSNPQHVFNTQQVAAYAAGKQNKFWNYAELFYHEQGAEDTPYVTEAYLTGIANQVTGLKLAKWQADRKDGALLTQLNNDETYATQEATAAGQSGATTPTLVMQGPKGAEIVPGTFDGYGFPSPSELVSAVKTVS